MWTEDILYIIWLDYPDLDCVFQVIQDGRER